MLMLSPRERLSAIGAHRSAATAGFSRSPPIRGVSCPGTWPAVRRVAVSANRKNLVRSVRPIGRPAHADQLIARSTAVSGPARSEPGGIPHRPTTSAFRSRAEWASPETRRGGIVAAACGRLCRSIDSGANHPGGAARRLPLCRRQPGRAMVGDTGSRHHVRRAQVWHIPDGALVANLDVDGHADASLSAPMGNGCCSASVPVPGLGSRHLEIETRRVSGRGYGFSPDQSHLLVLEDATKVLRLVEIETDRTVARLESPDLCSVNCATFSPDGSRLVVVTNEGPAVHVWDLRAIPKTPGRDGVWIGTRRPIPSTTPPGPRRPPCRRSRSTMGNSSPRSKNLTVFPASTPLPPKSLVARPPTSGCNPILMIWTPCTSVVTRYKSFVASIEPWPISPQHLRANRSTATCWRIEESASLI